MVHEGQEQYSTNREVPQNHNAFLKKKVIFVVVVDLTCVECQHQSCMPLKYRFSISMKIQDRLTKPYAGPQHTAGVTQLLMSLRQVLEKILFSENSCPLMSTHFPVRWVTC